MKTLILTKILVGVGGEKENPASCAQFGEVPASQTWAWTGGLKVSYFFKFILYIGCQYVRQVLICLKNKNPELNIGEIMREKRELGASQRHLNLNSFPLEN